MTRPHNITAAEMAIFFGETEVVAASATTADGTQRKRLLRRGSGLYITCRRYIGENGDWQPVYSGPDLDEAVRMYNGLG